MGREVQNVGLAGPAADYEEAVEEVSERAVVK